MIKELTMKKTSLTSNWVYGTLEDIVNKGSSNISLNKVKEDDGEYQLFSAKGYNKNISFFHQEKEYLAIIKDGAGIGRVSKHPAKSSVVATMQYLIPKEGFDIEFVQYFLNGIDFESHRQGSTIPHIYFKDYKSEPFPLLSLAQQKQIVATLDKAFATIDTAKSNAEQNLQNAKELFESYLQNIFENKGDDWENKPLSEVCDLIKRGSQPKYTESEAGEIVLNQKCIRDHKINLSVARKHNTNKKTINKERYIQLGDGLINSTGTGTLGRVAQVRELNFSAFVDTQITIVRPKKELFYLDFFGWALIYIEKIVQKSGEGASGQTELSRKVVEKFIISFPNEMKQQQQTAEKLDNLSLEIKKLEAIYTQKIADLEEMKKAILEKAFSGQLSNIN